VKAICALETKGDLQLVNNIQPNFLSILDPFVAVLGYNYHFIWNIWNLETKSTSLVNASLPFSSSVKLATLMAQLRLYLECKKLLLLGGSQARHNCNCKLHIAMLPTCSDIDCSSNSSGGGNANVQRIDCIN